MKDMNIVSFLIFLWNWIFSLFFVELNLFPPPGALLVKIFTNTFSLRKLSTKYFFLVDIHHFYGAASEPTSETMDGVIIWCILKRELSVAGSRQ